MASSFRRDRTFAAAVVPAVTGPALRLAAETTDARLPGAACIARGVPSVYRLACSMERKDLDGLSVAQLRECIATNGLSHADCLEKGDLRERAWEAIQQANAPASSSDVRIPRRRIVLCGTDQSCCIGYGCLLLKVVLVGAGERGMQCWREHRWR